MHATFTVSAAAINSVHRGLARALDVPVLIYGANTPVPQQLDDCWNEGNHPSVAERLCKRPCCCRQALFAA